MPFEYAVVVQGEKFLLSRAQIEFDSPNLFTSYFLDDGNEPPHERQLQLSRSSQLFSLIVEHLCGYTILPIAENAIPARMSRENAIKNLRVDADCYKLEGLVKLIDEHTSLANIKDVPVPRLSPLFHFPGRIASWMNGGAKGARPSGYIEFPLSLDLSKNFTIVCWYKARSNNGWHTLISMETPSAPHSLFYTSISPDRDFRFEIGINSSDRKASGSSGTPVRLNVWTHLAFLQQVDENGCTWRRALYLDGKELISTTAHPSIYDPTPSQNRMVIMRGSWARRRNAGFIGQAEDIAVYQRALEQDEIAALASKANTPADDGWETEGGD